MYTNQLILELIKCPKKIIESPKDVGINRGSFKKVFSEKQLVTIGSVIMGISILSIPFMSKNMFIPYQLLALATMTIANGAIGPSLLSTLSLTAAGNEQGALMGVHQSIGSLARFVGPLLGSVLYAMDVHLPYIVACVILVTCLLLIQQMFSSKKLEIINSTIGN